MTLRFRIVKDFGSVTNLYNKVKEILGDADGVIYNKGRASVVNFYYPERDNEFTVKRDNSSNYFYIDYNFCEGNEIECIKNKAVEKFGDLKKACKSPKL